MVRYQLNIHNNICQIGGIMVLYRPDWDTTGKAIATLAAQVDELCIVDNTPDTDNTPNLPASENITYIPLKENRGIAAAQNIGVRHFLDKDFDFVLFSDQDSEAPAGIVSELLNGHKILEEQGIKIATVGTRAINKQTGKPYPPKSKELGLPIEMKGDNTPPDITECYSVISSMSLTSTISLRLVGGFDESLFIDGVDHEWCWRAWHMKRLRSFIVETAKINHMLGEGDRKIGNKEISIASAFRVYYQFRNFLWLRDRDYTPKFWIKKNDPKFLVKTIYYPLFVKPRKLFLKNILRGIKDGLRQAKTEERWPSFQQEND